MLIQKLLHAVDLPCPQVRVALQPLLDFLFRTEEVVDPSPAAQEHPGGGGAEFRHLPLIYQYVNRRTGVLGGIVDRHFLVQPFRVDQREKVNGSISI